jgi:hypothetical protein
MNLGRKPDGRLAGLKRDLAAQTLSKENNRT